jgi:aminopeptidase-like protein
VPGIDYSTAPDGRANCDLELLRALDFADGHAGVIDIAERSRLPLLGQCEGAGLLRERGMLETAE